MKQRNVSFYSIVFAAIILLAGGCSFTSSELKTGVETDKDAQIARMQSVIDDQNNQLRQLNDELSKQQKTENLK